MTIHIGLLQENLKFYTTYKKNATGEFPKLDGKITIRILIKKNATNIPSLAKQIWTAQTTATKTMSTQETIGGSK
jgi:hypothetical protein